MSSLYYINIFISVNMSAIYAFMSAIYAFMSVICVFICVLNDIAKTFDLRNKTIVNKKARSISIHLELFRIFVLTLYYPTVIAENMISCQKGLADFMF